MVALYKNFNNVICKNLQQQNFKEILEIMSRIHGWKILEYTNLLALIAPVSLNFVNYVWGETSLANVQKVKDFYNDAPFTWLVEPNSNVYSFIFKFHVCCQAPRLLLVGDVACRLRGA